MSNFNENRRRRAFLIFISLGAAIYTVRVLYMAGTSGEAEASATMEKEAPVPETTTADTPISCKKTQTFVSKHNKTINGLLKRRHLEKIPFKKEEMVPAFIGYSENYIVEPKYNLLTCNIPKVLSTVKVGLFWLLNNETSYNERGGRYTLSSAQEPLLPGYTNFMIHREPMERFISGYIDKCINSNYCFQCEDNISCYLEEQYKRLMLFGNGFRLDDEHGMEDFHFAPQTWFCKLYEAFYDYRQIKYESGDKLEMMVDDIVQVLKDACVEEPVLQRIRSEMMVGKTGHSTRGSDSRSKYENEIQNNPRTVDLLTKMYYYDYIAFGYPLPRAAV